MKRLPILLVIMLLSFVSSMTAQKKVIFSTVPSDAEIFLEKNNRGFIILQKNSSTTGAAIRTRCIVKLGNTNPLRYVIKIVSEESIVPGTSVKENENFKEWNRLLNAYKDIISKIQARIS